MILRKALIVAVVLTAASLSVIRAGEISYWQQEAAKRPWQVLLIEEEAGVKGLLKGPGVEEWWEFSREKPVEDGMELADIKRTNITAFSPWWLRSPYGDGAAEGPGTRACAAEDWDRLRISFAGEERAFRRVATQVRREGEERIENIWKGEIFAPETDTIPLTMRWEDVVFTDGKFAPLTPLIGREVEEIQRDFLEWAPVRLQGVVAHYFDQAVIPAMVEYTPDRVTVLLFEIRRRSAASSEVDVRAASFAYENGSWERFDLRPADLGRLRPERITSGDEDPLEYELMQPDLEPCGWLPGGIGVWGTWKQGPAVMGIIFGRYVERVDEEEPVRKRQRQYRKSGRHPGRP